MRKCFLAAVLMFITSYVMGFQNPVDKFSAKTIFGDIIDGGFNTGIDIPGKQDVHSVQDGEIIYCSPDMVVVDHGDGIRTVYDDMDPEFEKFTVSGGEKIGHTDSCKTFHFEIYDSVMNELVNPLLMIDGCADRTRPEISSLFVSADGGVIRVEDGMSVKAGRTRLYMSIADDSADAAPYNVSVYLNGQELVDYNYETIRLDGLDFVLQSVGMRADEYYPGSGLIYIGEVELRQGNSRLEVEVSDFYGNRFLADCLLIAK